jgi:hypothetical protein
MPVLNVPTVVLMLQVRGCVVRFTLGDSCARGGLMCVQVKVLNLITTFEFTRR